VNNNSGRNKKMKQIAIDGPAGAGKSTIAKQLSKDLGYVYKVWTTLSH